MEKSDLVAIREGRVEDWNFFYSTFLRALYYGDSWFKEIPKDIFMENYHKVADVLLAKGILKVACLKEDPEVILGYALFSSQYPALHFVFVKSAWRGIGIAKSLVPKETKVATHLTKVGLSILKKNPSITFNPFLTP